MLIHNLGGNLRSSQPIEIDAPAATGNATLAIRYNRIGHLVCPISTCYRPTSIHCGWNPGNHRLRPIFELEGHQINAYRFRRCCPKDRKRTYSQASAINK